MDINTLRSISTLVCFAIFLGVLCWVCLGRNTERFSEAAKLPFALDESDGDGGARDATNPAADDRTVKGMRS